MRFHAFVDAIALLVTISSDRLVGEPCGVATFDTGAPLPISSARAVREPFLAADFDRDGRTDILLGTTLWVQQPDGSFKARPVSSLPATLQDASIVDVDTDGWPDLVAVTKAPGGTWTLQVFLNDHGGDFAPLAPFQAAGSLWGSPAFGDVDGDGVPDVAVAGWDPPASYAISVYRGDGHGGFRPPVVTRWDMPPGFNEPRLTLGDVDGDGKLDAIVGINGGFHPTYEIVLMRGTTGGSFEFVGTFGDSVGTVTALATADFDRDGKADVIVGNGSGAPGSGSVGVYLGRTLGVPVLTAGFSTGYAPNWLATADFNGDGLLDLAFPVQPASDASPGSSSIRVVLATPVGDFTGGGTVEVAGPFAFADMDGDGQTDAVTWQCDLIACRLVLDRITCDPAAAVPVRLEIPAALSLWGANGTRYETELTLLNAGAGTATVAISEGSYSGRDPELRQSVTVRAGNVITLSSAATDERSRLLLEPEDGGPLFLAVTGVAPGDVTATARITIAKAGAAGLAGVAFASRTIDDAFRTTSFIPWLKEDGTDRTNLAIVNHAGGGPVTLRVTLVSTDPSAPGSAVLPDLTLDGGHAVQWNRVLRSAGLSATSGWAMVERLSATGRYDAYAAINDATTSDGSIVGAVPAAKAGGWFRLLIPAAVGTDRFTTELVVTNVDAETRRLDVQFFSAGFQHLPPFMAIEVPGRSQLHFDDVMQALSDAGALDGLSAEERAAGALVISPREFGESTSGILAVARTRTRGLARYGVTYQAVDVADWSVGNGRIAPVREARTNLALMLPGDDQPFLREQVLVDVIAANGTRIRRMEVDVGEREWRQLDSILAGFPDASDAWIWIHSAYGAYAYAVLNDGGAPGTGTSDGTFILPR